MEQKPMESSTPTTQPSTPPAGSTADAQPAQPAAVSPAPQPAQSAPASTDQPPQTPSSGGSVPPATPAHHGNNAMIYAVITFILVLFGAGVVTYMNNSNPAEPATNSTVVAQPTQPPVVTIPPTIAPSPSLEEEVETVNVTENDSDLLQAEKDLQGL